MLRRVLDESYPAAVRRDVAVVTVTRITTNAAYRFAPPFLATIARGLDVDLADLGVALAVTELCGLASPLIGRTLDGLPRRTSMLVGLGGIAAGAVAAGASRGVIAFTVALFVLALSKIVFDVGLGSWIADHVPYERRGRVVGLTETSWALGLLVGVSTMGLVTAASSWRVAYLLAAAAVLTMAVVVARRLGGERPPSHAAHEAGAAPPIPPAGWMAVAALFALMSSSQTVFVTFGAWLEDRFDVGAAGLAAVVFGLGGLELTASSLSAARTDRWGKEASVLGGTAVMVPAGLALAALDDHLVPGLLALGVFIAAFEFCIVSAIPIGSELVPGRPARGIGTMIACGTLGRAAAAVPATRLYDRFGLTPPALLGAALAAVAALAMHRRTRLVARPLAAPVGGSR